MITDDELTRKMDEISNSLSLASLYTPTIAQQDKMLDTITRIIRDTTRGQLLSHDPRVLIICTLKILLRYEDMLHANRLCEWRRRRKFKTARVCYHDLLHCYLPEKTRQVVEAVVEIVYQDCIWKFETFCYEVMCSLLDANSACGGLITHAIWDRLLESKPGGDTIDVEDARGIVRVLNELLDVHDWPATQDTVKTVEKMLDLFHASIIDSRTTTTASSSINLDSSSTALPLANFKKSLEVCLRSIVRHLSNDQILLIVQRMCSWTVAANMSDEFVLEFGSILEYAACAHRTVLYEQTLTPMIFPLLMQMVGSTSRLISLLGNRVLQYLLDRKENRTVFDTPRIFFEHTRIDVRIATCHKEDRLFLKLHRESLHNNLLRSLLNHWDSRINLETTYCTVCLIAVEVPCGFTAAALVCLTMNLQEIVLQRRSGHPEVKICHVHAIIISIMSLLCWIHNAKVFYGYVKRIMLERAQWAPHLNPPIQSQYSFAVHHVLWNKPELFFVDWEARYGLWKCFRLGDRISFVD